LDLVFHQQNSGLLCLDSVEGWTRNQEEILGSFFNGILITDFFGAYNRLRAFAKQMCIVHLLREIKQVSLRNHAQEWKAFARRLKRLMHDALKLVIARNKFGVSAYQNQVANLHVRLADIFWSWLS